jgi:hypothetical protein
MINLEEHGINIKKGAVVLDRRERTVSQPDGKKKALEVTFYNRLKTDNVKKPYAATVKIAGQYFSHEGIKTLSQLFTEYFKGRYYPNLEWFEKGSHINLPDRFDKTYIILPGQAKREYTESDVPASEVDKLKARITELEKENNTLRNRISRDGVSNVSNTGNTGKTSKKKD